MTEVQPGTRSQHLSGDAVCHCCLSLGYTSTYFSFQTHMSQTDAANASLLSHSGLRLGALAFAFGLGSVGASKLWLLPLFALWLYYEQSARRSEKQFEAIAAKQVRMPLFPASVLQFCSRVRLPTRQGCC